MRKVKKAFDNGIDAIIKKVNHLLADIPLLPSSGIPGGLIHDSESLRQELHQLKTGLDFHEKIPDFQARLATLEDQIKAAAEKLIDEEKGWLEVERQRLQKLKDWGLLGEDDRIRMGDHLDALYVEASTDLKGIQKIINDRYRLTQKLKDIEKEIHFLAQKDEGQEEGAGEPRELLVDFSELPALISGPDEIDEIIAKLEALKAKLDPYTTIRMNWKLQVEKPE